MSNVPPMPLGVVAWPSAVPAIIEEPAGGGGGAPTNAQYVTLATNATLTQERVLTAGTGITLTDGGAGGNLTIDAAGANTTLVSVDFGSGKGDTSATAAVTGLTWVTSASAIACSVIGPRAEDAVIEELTVAISDIVNGDGFTVQAASPLGSVGVYVVACVGV